MVVDIKQKTKKGYKKAHENIIKIFPTKRKKKSVNVATKDVKIFPNLKSKGCLSIIKKKQKVEKRLAIIMLQITFFY